MESTLIYDILRMQWEITTSCYKHPEHQHQLCQKHLPSNLILKIFHCFNILFISGNKSRNQPTNSHSFHFNLYPYAHMVLSLFSISECRNYTAIEELPTLQFNHLVRFQDLILPDQKLNLIKIPATK